MPIQTVKVIVERITSRIKATLVNSSGTEIGTATNPLVTTGSGGGGTSSVVVTASALPASAATSALQTTGNSSLSTIAGKDFATQTTLAAIKDTDGIKKVTDPVAVTTMKPDGTNTMPSLDAAGRAGFVKLTDGVETVDVETVEIIEGGSFPAGIVLTTDNWFGPTTLNSTVWQTDVNLVGPDGAASYPSGNGDLVMLITRTAGTVDVSVMVQYHTIA